MWTPLLKETRIAHADGKQLQCPGGEGVLGGAAGGSALEAPGPVLQGDAAALQQVAHPAGRLVRPVLAGGGVAARSPCKHSVHYLAPSIKLCWWDSPQNHQDLVLIILYTLWCTPCLDHKCGNKDRDGYG